MQIALVIRSVTSRALGPTRQYPPREILQGEHPPASFTHATVALWFVNVAEPLKFQENFGDTLKTICKFDVDSELILMGCGNFNLQWLLFYKFFMLTLLWGWSWW